MREIELTRGLVAIVDDEDYEFLSQWKWYAYKSGRTFYAARSSPRDENGKKHTIRMHRVVAERMGLDITGREVDHKNQDGLNNQRENLRIGNNSQQGANQNRPRNNTSGYKGVSWQKDCNKWQASICIHGRCKYLGLFTDKIQAALAYNRAAVEYFGDFAVLNIIPPGAT